MPDKHKIIDNPDIPSPKREDRERELQDWDEVQAQQNAAQQGIELTDAHWQVIHCLRDYYLNHGPAGNGREVSDMLNSEFATRGGRKYLRALFPQGPVSQGMRIAGLKLPPLTEDDGFGVSF